MGSLTHLSRFQTHLQVGDGVVVAIKSAGEAAVAIPDGNKTGIGALGDQGHYGFFISHLGWHSVGMIACSGHLSCDTATGSEIQVVHQPIAVAPVLWAASGVSFGFG